MTEPTAARVQRTFDAPARDVFDALVNPEVMRRWWHAGEDWETPPAEADQRRAAPFASSCADRMDRNTPAPGNTPSSTRRGGWPFSWSRDDEQVLGQPSQVDITLTGATASRRRCSTMRAWPTPNRPRAMPRAEKSPSTTSPARRS